MSNLILSFASDPSTTSSWLTSPLDFSGGLPAALLAFCFCLFSSPFFPVLPGDMRNENRFLFLLLSDLPGGPEDKKQMERDTRALPVAATLLLSPSHLRF